MIIVDLNQVVFSTIAIQSKNDPIDENMVRHITLNCIRSYRQKFSKFGELVLASDGKNSWRKDVFPFYKANRKKARDKATHVDWTVFFEAMDIIKQELKETFPYKFIKVDKAEGDDIIAVLARDNKHESVLIISSDKDFIQLQKYPHVQQWSPMLKKMVVHDNPEGYLIEHVIRGDRGDGIPNVCSVGSTFVNGGRQKPISKAVLARYYDGEPVFRKELIERNKRLIDFDYIPEDIVQAIRNEYEQPVQGDRSKFFNYFTKHRLRNLMEHITEF